jgi:arginase family enzyme
VSFNQEALDEVRALVEVPDDADIGKIHKPRAVSAINERVADDVAAIQERGALPLTLGGDHSLVSVQWGGVCQDGLG